MHLNYPEQVYKHPAYLASPVRMYSEKAQYSRTTTNCTVKGLYTPCYLGRMWFLSKVRGVSIRLIAIMLNRSL